MKYDAYEYEVEELVENEIKKIEVKQQNNENTKI